MSHKQNLYIQWGLHDPSQIHQKKQAKFIWTLLIILKIIYFLDKNCLFLAQHSTHISFLSLAWKGRKQLSLAYLGEARGCSTNTVVIHWSSHLLLFLPLGSHHLQTVRYHTSSHKLDYYVALILNILSLTVGSKDGNFAEMMDFDFWWSCIGKGLCLQACFNIPSDKSEAMSWLTTRLVPQDPTRWFFGYPLTLSLN